MNKNIKNSYKILSVLSLAVLISCSGSDMSSSSSDEGPIYKGPYYNEFLMCNAGSDFTEENVSEMMTAYKELPVPDGLGWSGIYSPVGEDHRYSNGWWELEWTSKESADEAWNNPSAEFLLGTWKLPSFEDWKIIFIIGIFSSIGGYLISQAYRVSEAGLIAPFEYVSLILAVLWGIMFFNEWLSISSAIGVILIISSGVYVAYREIKVGSPISAKKSSGRRYLFFNLKLNQFLMSLYTLLYVF